MVVDAEAQLGGSVVATFAVGADDDAVPAPDFVEGLARRAKALGLWPSAAGAEG